ncbi:AfsR/SARP family transcriptional regulator [Fischerella sp. PCC 9605]|uniref:AfsR/SARP family transcriptional regulator n=1 Tax=Fischerella sp. PCC 9605 TaxID=1173024 RepID=UPI00047DE9C1|nr:BTAD domain-containing putative transcriptional regulator [Fischerella sp. PCC 9605]
MADSTLRITLLGDFRLTYADQPVCSVNTERLQSLLAYLVLHHQSPQPRSRLAFYFWADSPEAQARTNLRRELHYLRQALPDADRFVQADAKTIQWRTDAPFTLDVAEFEAAIAQAERDADWALVKRSLEKAAMLYQGDLLPNCYDDWVETERSQLQQSCIRALERLIRLLEEQQDDPAAIRYAQQLLRIDPLQESTYCTLMRLYACNGDRASALRVYQQCADILQRELNDEPGAATREVYEQARTMKLPLVAKPLQQNAPISIVPQMPVKPATNLIGSVFH